MKSEEPNNDDSRIDDKNFIAVLKQEEVDYKSGKDLGVDLEEELLSTYAHRKVS